uniref:Uncharacterized protein n=1 Tax=Chromera velia CCMP2878 TaxID=1169474 RepID=A0A0G4HU81_9ALVE|eukprot:Cvel_31762.t1-p1 / transcript=Cvel_31762.t1 / gene=Cvel_31762 / organism=Chromera_velia_CCMP2878 / gene_product=hypothetical protein / transcript_product=hypothetical protein / location=Cvel_scaffold4792:2947-4531(-) / protein_length=304 / sequence_SO=supercontig / SO=protein_coding / is_pseudo=false
MPGAPTFCALRLGAVRYLCCGVDFLKTFYPVPKKAADRRPKPYATSRAQHQDLVDGFYNYPKKKRGNDPQSEFQIKATGAYGGEGALKSHFCEETVTADENVPWKQYKKCASYQLKPTPFLRGEFDKIELWVEIKRVCQEEKEEKDLSKEHQKKVLNFNSTSLSAGIARNLQKLKNMHKTYINYKEARKALETIVPDAEGLSRLEFLNVLHEAIKAGRLPTTHPLVDLCKVVAHHLKGGSVNGVRYGEGLYSVMLFLRAQGGKLAADILANGFAVKRLDGKLAAVAKKERGLRRANQGKQTGNE